MVYIQDTSIQHTYTYVDTYTVHTWRSSTRWTWQQIHNEDSSDPVYTDGFSTDFRPKFGLGAKSGTLYTSGTEIRPTFILPSEGQNESQPSTEIRFAGERSDNSNYLKKKKSWLYYINLMILHNNSWLRMSELIHHVWWSDYSSEVLWFISAYSYLFHIFIVDT